MSDNPQSAKVGTCHACGGTVSKSAKTCPQCGEKKPYRGKDRKAGLGTWLFLIFGFFIMMGQIANLSGSGSSSSGTANAYGSESDARQKCEKAIRISVNNPSTVDIQSVVGYGTDVAADGTRRITQSFSAKNSFGLKQSYDAYCTIKPNGELDIKIAEQGR